MITIIIIFTLIVLGVFYWLIYTIWGEVTQDKFSIEYYPITKRYYPKYRHYYMRHEGLSGTLEPIEDYLFTYANYGRTEKEAKEIIEKFKEQQLGVNVVKIKVD